MNAVAVAENIRENLASEMGRQGISQSELARRAGVRQATISDILRGKMEPSISICEQIANGLGIRADTIFLEPPKKAS